MKVERHEVGNSHIRNIEYLGEYDIIRFADHYGRVANAQ